MENSNINYQFTMFGEFVDISPNDPKITMNLMNKYLEKGYSFLPSVFQEIPFNIMPSTLNNRLVLSNNDGWQMNIGNNRIDLWMKYKLNGRYSDMNLQAIKEEAITILKVILETYERKANRIALNTIKIYDEENSRNINLKLADKNNIVPFYDENKPYEWYKRLVSKQTVVEINNEEINIITDISNSSGQITIENEIKLFNGIILKFDINTMPTNLKPRFDIDDINNFFNAAIVYKNNIENSIEEIEE